MNHPRKIAALLLLALCAGGCGGGSGSAPSRAASVSFTIKWPAPSRFIPVTAKSVRIDLTDATGFSASQTITQSATTTTFPAVPVGIITAKATAFGDPVVDPSQRALATGTVLFATQAGAAFSQMITMDTTIDHLLVSSTGSFAVRPGGSVQLTATAADKDGHAILTDQTKNPFQWANDNPSVISITASGSSATISGLAPGGAVITVTDPETNKSKSVSFTVSASAGNASLSFTNIPAVVDASNGSKSLRVDVANSSSQIVATRVVGLPLGGTVDIGSLPLGNASSGTFTVTASVYPFAGAAGVPQATASRPITIQADQTTSLSIPLATTVDHVVVSPATATVATGKTLALTANAVNANGDRVLVALSTVTWSGGPGAVLTVDNTGLVTGVAKGSGTASATYSEFGVTRTTPSPAQITVVPATGSGSGEIR